jgi:tRNA-2-methylthio-N6-dimethylallyladenosine synthase
MSTVPDAPAVHPRTYQIRTYGCQMNAHDSERLAGLLEEAGYLRCAEGAEPDVVIFNTCAVRENADNRLYGSLGNLLPAKKARPGMQIAVGGCLAQKDKGVVGRCGVRYPQHLLATGAAGTRPYRRRGTS